MSGRMVAYTGLSPNAARILLRLCVISLANSFAILCLAVALIVLAVTP